MCESVEVLAVALHEEHRQSPGVPLNPKRCVRCRVTAKRLAEIVHAHLREVAADEGVRERVARVLANRCGRGLDLPSTSGATLAPCSPPSSTR